MAEKAVGMIDRRERYIASADHLDEAAADRYMAAETQKFADELRELADRIEASMTRRRKR
jgi:hypothetical protein